MASPGCVITFSTALGKDGSSVRMHVNWQLDSTQARLETAMCGGTINLAQPAQGLAHLRISGSELPAARLLGVMVPGRGLGAALHVDAYVRGHDLIVTYAESAEQPFRTQIYWRLQTARYPGALLALEAILSMQTPLLDTLPQRTVESLLPAQAGFYWHAHPAGSGKLEPWDASSAAKREFDATQTPGCLGFALPSIPATYVEIVHPAEFAHTALDHLTPGGGATATHVRHRLLAQPLEKGVILRSRVLGLLLPAEVTAAQVAECYDAFVSQPLPLTT